MTESTERTQYMRRLQDTWEAWAQADPLWAICTQPEARGGRWDPDAFFATGRSQVAELMVYLDQVHPNLPKATALDFGCGVGRLTQALCANFLHVYGVDISPTMIRLADGFNRWAGQCRYRLNDQDDLIYFASNRWDLIYSHITLQHIAPAATARYLSEFVRLLSPQGLAVFQLPSRPLWRPIGSEPWDSLDSWGVAGGGPVGADGLQVVMEMYTIEREAVAQIIKAAGGEIVDVQECPGGGPDFESLRYAARRR